LQVIVNLLRNAVEASSPEKTIKIRLRPDHPSASPQRLLQ
jgi:signal transduction histidine kinase